MFDNYDSKVQIGTFCEPIVQNEVFIDFANILYRLKFLISDTIILNDKGIDLKMYNLSKNCLISVQVMLKKS